MQCHTQHYLADSIKAIKMRHALLVLLLLFVLSSFGQTEDTLTVSNLYYRYVDCYFKSSFSSRDKTIKEFSSVSNSQTNYLSVHFSADSTYSIRMEFLEKNDSTVRLQYYEFNGRYKILSIGKLLLIGNHPFDSNEISVKERVTSKSISILGFSYKLSEKFAWSNNRKLSTFCDGSCEVNLKD